MPTIDEILNSKNKLKSTQILVTLENGDTRVEERQTDGTFLQVPQVELDEVDDVVAAHGVVAEVAETAVQAFSKRRQKKVERLRRFGFVVDLKPDLNIGQALPGLFVGSQDVAGDATLLEKHGITHIVNCGSSIPNFFEKKFEYLRIHVLDLPTEQIRRHFEHVHEFIDNSLRNEGKVFVHCNAGISRSVTLVVSYMMKTEGMTFQKALEIVKRARTAARPNDGFVKTLRAYEVELSNVSE